jgi:hypothetical protein
MAWHALEFSACFLVTSAAMAGVLIGGRRASHRIPSHPVADRDIR